MKEEKQDDTTYWDYLRVPDLLNLQHGLEESDDDISADELHFIIVHQVFELWFKLLLRELRLSRDRLDEPRVEEETIPYVVHHIKRINTILRQAAEHFNLMETLTPQDFLEFRGKLGTASGFQSYQLREIEFLMGLEQEQREEQDHGSPTEYIIKTAGMSEKGDEIIKRLQQVQEEPSLRDALHRWLYRTPIHGSGPSDEGDREVVENFIEDYLEKVRESNQKQIEKLIEGGGDEDEIQKQFEQAINKAEEFLYATDFENDEKEQLRMSRIRSAILFIESYRELPLLAWPRLLIDTVVEMEEEMLGFRFHHARMVERIIGRRVGTGGSSGVDYLDETLQYRIFPELWAVRTMLLPEDKLPFLKDEEFYSFVSDVDSSYKNSEK